MKNVQQLIKDNGRLHLGVVETKLWLAAKEQMEYSAYLEGGGNARTAKDKVIAELIGADVDTWQDRIYSYEKLKVDMLVSDNLLQVVKSLISNDKDEIAENLIGDIGDLSEL